MSAEEKPDLRNEIKKYKRELEHVSEPNCGRIRELQEKILKKKLFTQEAIQESAERLAARFFGNE